MGKMAQGFDRIPVVAVQCKQMLHEPRMGCGLQPLFPGSKRLCRTPARGVKEGNSGSDEAAEKRHNQNGCAKMINYTVQKT